MLAMCIAPAKGMARFPYSRKFALVLGLIGVIAATSAVPASAAKSNRAQAPSDHPQAKDARLGGDVNRTRFVADLSKEVEFTIRTLPDPYRVIVDLPDVNFQMPDGLGSKGRGLVSAFRYGNFAKGKSRIVIDVKEPVIVEKAFVRPAENDQPARLVIDLVRTTRAEFIKRYQDSLAEENRKKADSAGWQTSTDNPGNQELGKGGKPDDQSNNAKDKGKPVVVIDPGHGGIDPGTSSSSGVYEKAIILAFALELKKQLDNTGRFKVLMTRDSDVFIPLPDRVSFAHSNGCNLFISLHADAIDPKHPLLGAAGPKVVQEVRGASIYTLDQQASDTQAQISAARENLSDVIAGVEEGKNKSGDDVSNILADLVQRATKNESREFSNILVSYLKGKTQLNQKPQRFANFKVLRAPDVPSVLIELGYLSNPEDEKQMTSEEWRVTVAEAVTSAVTTFFSRSQGRLPF